MQLIPEWHTQAAWFGFSLVEDALHMPVQRLSLFRIPQKSPQCNNVLSTQWPHCPAAKVLNRICEIMKFRYSNHQYLNVDRLCIRHKRLSFDEIIVWGWYHSPTFAWQYPLFFWDRTLSACHSRSRNQHWSVYLSRSRSQRWKASAGHSHNQSQHWRVITCSNRSRNRRQHACHTYSRN